MHDGLIEFEVGGKMFKEMYSWLDKSSKQITSALSDAMTLNQVNNEGFPILNRPLRGFEALMDYLRTDGKYRPSEVETRQLFDIECAHFRVNL